MSVIIPALNAAGFLDKTLGGLAAQDFDGPFEVIVVDDGSDDDTIAVAAGSAIAPEIVRCQRGGPGPARNEGVRHARAPILAFLDADCTPTSAWLREGVAATERWHLVQGRVLPDPEAAMSPFDRTLWVTALSPLFESASMFVRRDLFDRLGGFEDWLVIRRGKPLAEDVWFGWRARREGAQIGFAAKAVAHHAVFERGPRGYVAERVRAHYFPAIIDKVPELRNEFLFHRLFLTRHSARTDVAVAGTALAALARSPWPLVLSAPYLAWLWRRAGSHRGNAPLVAATEITADLVGLVSLAAGSVRWRTPVL